MGLSSRNKAYDDDLAYVHDAGFGDYTTKAAPGILATLQKAGIRDGLIVELGCGSGLLARILVDAGYDVVGIDLSSAMIRLARKRVPEATFRVDSVFTAAIPACAAVVSVGECLNYAFDARNSAAARRRLFSRIHKALSPGGLFIFDVAEPGQTKGPEPERNWTAGEDWAVLVEKTEDAKRRRLTRAITTFRKHNGHYRKHEETHRQQLLVGSELAAQLRAVGFAVRTARSYGAFRLPGKRMALTARRR